MEKKKRSELHKKCMLVVPFIIVFCILGAVVFRASKQISSEMSQAAISNLSENLELISNTIETLMNQQASFQKMIAQELADAKDLDDVIQSYEGNDAMVKLSVLLSDKKEGISNTGEPFTADALNFSAGKTVDGLPLSESYVNSMGTWAYTMKCPIIKDGKEIATLYVEYIYDVFDKTLPNSFYNNEAKLYLFDTASERLVLKPKGMSELEAGHMTLDDFYYANKINDSATQSNVATHMKDGKNVMFYHDIRNEESLVYMWSVNDGSAYLIGYVPIVAIQREGNAVNQNILTVVFVTLAAFFSCCVLYFIYERQHNKIRKEREAEREFHNKQLKEALQAAQIASSSKTMFLSNMSHDIRTPMNAILGFATLLEKDADNPKRVRDYTGKIKSSGQHLLSLINDVLDISKIESGKAVLTIGEFTLQDMIDAVDAIIRPAAKAKKQNFTISVTDVKHKRLIGDETRLNQILINLLSNAVKYTQDEGNIWLRITGLTQRSSQYEHIRIEVEDNGYGMTPEYLKTIFDAFTRAENSTTNKVQGTGLGMAITKNLVELMGGTIEVTSEMGSGSKFVVELELHIPETELSESQDNGSQPAADAEDDCLNGKHFLVAEDNEINSEILCELLQMEGASCEIVENGQLAVETFQHAPPEKYDAILMDVQMPIMNGYDATRAIRSLEREDAKQIPIIAMTANAFAEDVKDALEAGMNAHIAKPIDMTLLKKTVSQYL
ncbi:MAG: ATP-binding protein [Clostridium sp.]|nr:ATP-binding protein [Clostridium sp.]MCM1459211.1 ATP-binding protein [Bacteroides sp.]